MSDLRNKLIKLAHDNPELRADLLPLLKEASDRVAIDMDPGQFARVQQDLNRLAKEQCEFEVMDDDIYAYCSERGALRLFYAYNKHTRNKNTSAGPAQGSKWYFKIKI